MIRRRAPCGGMFPKLLQRSDLVSSLPTCVLGRKAAEQQKREHEGYCGMENESSVDLSMHVCLAGPRTPAMPRSVFQRDHHSFSNYWCWQSSRAGK